MSTQPPMCARFWGVRGTIPSAGPDTVRYGGNTPCVEVRCGEHLIILDAGTGIRVLGNTLMSTMSAVDVDIFFPIVTSITSMGCPFFCPPLRKEITCDYGREIYCRCIVSRTSFENS